MYSRSDSSNLGQLSSQYRSLNCYFAGDKVLISSGKQYKAIYLYLANRKL
jgi:hypothetical protein